MLNIRGFEIKGNSMEQSGILGVLEYQLTKPNRRFVKGTRLAVLEFWILRTPTLDHMN